MNDHPFAQYLRILGKGPKSRRSLTLQEAEEAMQMVLDEKVSDKQLGAFLLLMRANGETEDELQGFITAIRRKFINLKANNNIDLDFSAYAGKWRYPPYFLLAIKLLIKNGYKSLVHGDSGQFDNRQYIEQYLQDLDFIQAKSIGEATELVAQCLPVYLPLQNFAPQLRNILHLKEELGVRTVFNTVVKLLNPLNSANCIQGIYHKGVENLHHSASFLNGCQRNLVFKGEGGEPEIRPDALTNLYFSEHASEHTSAQTKHTFTENKFTAIVTRNTRPKQWDVEDLLALWQGEKADDYGKYTVIATTAVSLMLTDSISSDLALTKAEKFWASRHH